MAKAERMFSEFLKVVQILTDADAPLTKREIADTAHIRMDIVHGHLMRLTRSKWVRSSLPETGSEKPVAEYRYELTTKGEKQVAYLQLMHAE